MTVHVTVWNEFIHEREDRDSRQVYPCGMHAAIAESLSRDPDLRLRTATLDQPGHGLGGEVLDGTDVLLWWGHRAHDQVPDELARRVKARVLDGMGLIVLHSGHFAKVFISLMGTTCALGRWRESGERERLTVIDRSHSIAKGVPPCFDLPRTEMYGEPFEVPKPDHVVLLSRFEGGEVFRSGCCWRRGRGRVFYFRPGHETYPVFFDPNVQLVLRNAVHWCAPLSARL